MPSQNDLILLHTEANDRFILDIAVQVRGGVSVGAVGATAPTVFSVNLIDAEFLHPQFKRRIEFWQSK